MKGLLLVVFLSVWPAGAGYGQNGRTMVHIKDLQVRDPFVVADPKDKVYYLYKASPVGRDKQKANGVVAYKSKDLEHWDGPYPVFSIPGDNWIKGPVWAPEVHRYQGKYYLFATLNSDIEWKKAKANWPRYTFRGTQIFYSDSPLGPFLPFAGRLPHTPMDRMALDGTLWVEDGVPYMIYCHEWVQIEDGAMELVALTPDLSKPRGAPLTLFHASSAPWSTGNQRPDGVTSYVTDGCFLYRTRTNKLLMIWSSFKNGSYAIGIAESTTGKVTGPWVQQKDLLVEENSGHGMLFKTFSNQLMLTFHGPNSPDGSERAHFYEVIDNGATLTLKR
ncbi:glycoside hydrolase family 43 protein [Niabella drilacis]|uniref:Glycosyl hydrolases family 43 n=1 Tax=Niabella drilacis (strain DSM 25811 / CCM 8410 / CCUG 62505 / LMG 26954 / E90) TaxID=1285928 RepID=A0A1G6Y1A5_NIADE|nr:glycoside hydrolase family 43 protein [Niabella drilacis]SDD84061.1 Glycosyl hydrolases family 43 [Niabella drilacis]